MYCCQTCSIGLLKQDLEGNFKECKRCRLKPDWMKTKPLGKLH